MSSKRQEEESERERVQWGHSSAQAFFCSSQVRTLSGGCLPQEHSCACVGAEKQKPSSRRPTSLHILTEHSTWSIWQIYINDHNHLSEGAFSSKETYNAVIEGSDHLESRG